MNRILIIQTAFLGDVILATCLVEKLRTFFPGAVIDFFLRKGNEGLLEGHPFLGKVLVFDKKDKMRQLVRHIRDLRAQRYDLIVNTHRYFSSGLIAVSAAGKQVVGFDKNPLSFAYTRAYPHEFGNESNPIHEVTRNLSLIRDLTDDSFFGPKLYPPASAYENIPNEDFICVAPASVWFTKQLPARAWIRFMDEVPRRLSIFLLGGPGDWEVCEEIRTRTNHPKVQNRTGLSLLESAAWMQKARMTYANDSAPVHLASAVDAPVTVVFCSTVPHFGFTPLSTQSHIVQTEEKLSCRPCSIHGKNECPEGHFRCSYIRVRQLLDCLDG